MNAILIATVSLLVLLFLASTYFMIKFAMIILKIEEVLEDSMRTLEEREQSISEILEIPLFYDSPQVRQVHDDIKECKDAVYKIANSLSSNVSSAKDEETSFEEEEKN